MVQAASSYQMDQWYSQSFKMDNRKRQPEYLNQMAIIFQEQSLTMA